MVAGTVICKGAYQEGCETMRLKLQKRRERPQAGSPPGVHVWSPGPNAHNFGDSLFLAIVNRILDQALEPSPADYPGRLFYPGGSVLHLCREGDIAWGIGANLNAARWRDRRRFAKSLDIRCVRGPLTAAFVRDFLELVEPPVGGDPAILAPRFFKEWSEIQSRGMVGLVQHYSDPGDSNGISEEVQAIDPLRDPMIVVPEILSCDLVVSSSLHGIIVAEAFGIPARWLRAEAGGPASMKFYDYYLQTGRAPRPAESTEEAIRAGGEPLPDIDDEVLLKTFPWDVFPRPASLDSGA